MKKTILALACVFLLAGCKDVKLANGENAVVTFKEGGISSEELYNVLKSSYGAEKIMNLIDTHLLNELYETTNEEKSYINQTVKSVKESAKSMNANLDLYLQYYYGVSNIDAYKDYLSLDYKRNLWINDYAIETVSEKQINDYYDSEVVGDMEASHILITVDASTADSDEDKEAAEQKAYKTAKEIIAKLKNGEDFSSLAKQYSKDEVTSNNGGSMGKVNDGDYSETIINELKDLKVGTYTTTPVKDSDGYHILLKSAQDEKPKLDEELTTEIKSIIGKEIAQDSSFSIKALEALREKNEMKFVDTELEKAFNTLMNRYKNSSNN